METYIEPQDDKFLVQLSGFCDNIDPFKVTLKLDNTKVDALKDSAKLAAFIIPFNVSIQDFAHQFTAYKKLMRYGHGNDVLGSIPQPPAYPVSLPTVTVANIQAQFADIIQDAVQSGNLSIDIARALGILKEEAPFDPQAGKPIIKVKYSEGGHPLSHVKLGKYQGWQYWKDRGDGQGYVLAKEVLHPDYLDLDQLPAIGTTKLIKLKAIYLYQDKQAGEFSDEVSLTVFGHV